MPNSQDSERSTKLKWHGVNSSNLRAIAYDSTQCWLFVEFLDGSIYAYMDYPRQQWLRFLTAGHLDMYEHSWGKFFHREVMGKGYIGIKVQDKEQPPQMDAIHVRKMFEQSLALLHIKHKKD